MSSSNKFIGIISQARTTSSRLPEKVLKKINGKTLLEYHLERLKESGLTVFVATTVNKTDDVIVKICNKHNVKCFRGDEFDVLSRYVGLVKEYNLKTIVRVTSDCPLIDGNMIAEAVKQYQEKKNSRLYYSNCIQRTFPRGFDFEIFSDELLFESFESGEDQQNKEHVTPYMYRNRTSSIIMEHYLNDKDCSGYRLTVDELKDFHLIDKLISDYRADKKDFKEIVNILEYHPELTKINKEIEQKKI